MYGITFNFPKRECINGIPRATELPKQEERPRRALSSVLFCNKNLETWKPIKKINIPPPKKDISNNNVSLQITFNLIEINKSNIYMHENIININ